MSTTKKSNSLRVRFRDAELQQIITKFSIWGSGINRVSEKFYGRFAKGEKAKSSPEKGLKDFDKQNTSSKIYMKFTLFLA